MLNRHRLCPILPPYISEALAYDLRKRWVYWWGVERRYSKLVSVHVHIKLPGYLERVFDALWTQSPLRMTSFADVTFEIPKDAPKLHDTFEAKHVIRYLEDYVDR